MQGAGSIGGEASIAREPAGTCEERDMGQHHVTHHEQHHVTHDQHHHHQQQQQLAAAAAAAATAFHISRPSHSISTIISPPPLHHASIILDQEHPFHVPRIMLPTDNFQVTKPDVFFSILSVSLH